jgi:hypothetical protein
MAFLLVSQYLMWVDCTLNSDKKCSAKTTSYACLALYSCDSEHWNTTYLDFRRIRIKSAGGH